MSFVLCLSFLRCALWLVPTTAGAVIVTTDDPVATFSNEIFTWLAHPPLQPLTAPLPESLSSDWFSSRSSDTGLWAWTFCGSRKVLWLASWWLAALWLVGLHYFLVVVTCRSVIGPYSVGSALTSWSLDADWSARASSTGSRACLIASTSEIVFPHLFSPVHFISFCLFVNSTLVFFSFHYVTRYDTFFSSAFLSVYITMHNPRCTLHSDYII